MKINTARLSVCSRSLIQLVLLFGIAVMLSGCANTLSKWFGSTGPTSGQIDDDRAKLKLSGVEFIDVDSTVAAKLVASRKQRLFSDTFEPPIHSAYVIDAGDVIQVSVWEAQPAMLFGATDPKTGTSTAQMTAFPQQMVNSAGQISLPFAGEVLVAGQTPQQVQAEIVQLYKDKANQLQVLVVVVQKNTANVTVTGDVTASARIPLTARGEKLLDALAAAGGAKQPVNKTTLQLTRGNQVQSLSLDTIIRDPRQNVVLQPGDIITALFQPLSFTVLGAAGKNEEINYESQGITLAQALGRVGGLQDGRADARAVFIFRFEDPKIMNWPTPPKVVNHEGKVPAIYKIDMNDPANFFVAQTFPISNKDIIYVSDAPSSQMQRFISMVFQGMFMVKTFTP